jgi:hypothetical protein
MINFNYFFTPIGPEYKKKFARNFGIAILILFSFYGIWSLANDVQEPIISSENEKICDPGPIFEDGYCYKDGEKILFDSEKSHEKSSGTFYPRIHISIFPNTETKQQYIDPDFVTIGPGSQVTWSNYDEVPVSLNSIDSDNAWSTSVISPDGYDTVTFEETGIYEYRGNVGIHGIIVVMDDDEELSSKFSGVFGNGSPLMYTEGLEPVLLYDNCKRYAYWLTEHQKEKIDLYEDYPRYPPWGNQIFPLVDFCVTNGDLVKTVDDQIHWEFQLENEN